LKEPHHISFDEQIKSAFEGAKMDPPSGVWESVSGQIGQQVVVESAQTVFFKSVLSKVVAVAVMGAAVTGGYFGIQKAAESSRDKNQPIQKESISQTNRNIENSGVEEVNFGGTTDITIEPTIKPKDISDRSKASELVSERENKPNPISTDNQNQAIHNGSGGPKLVVNTPSNAILTLYQPDSVFCPGEVITYSVRSTAFFDQILWVCLGADVLQSDRQSAKLRYHKEGVYELKILAIAGQTQVQVSRRVYIKSAALTLTSSLVSGKVFLSTKGDKFNRYVWNLNDQIKENSSAESFMLSSMDYPGIEKLNVRVTGVKNEYCKASSQLEVTLPQPAKEPFVPNVFTPTVQDGKNDCFSVEIDRPEFYLMVIKNRNGRVVFQSEDPAECWNGKVLNKGEDCPPDAYFYQFIYKLMGSEKVSKNGRLQLF
jgi:hypothetical protein